MSYKQLAVLFIASISFIGCGKPAADDEFVKRVSPATPQQLNKIQAGLEKGFSLHPNGYTVKSRAHSNAYYVAARLQGSGVDEFAAWSLSGDPNSETGMILSADSVAAEFSDWPKGSETKANAWITDEDCSKLLGYAKQKR